MRKFFEIALDKRWVRTDFALPVFVAGVAIAFVAGFQVGHHGSRVDSAREGFTRGVATGWVQRDEQIERTAQKLGSFYTRNLSVQCAAYKRTAR